MEAHRDQHQPGEELTMDAKKRYIVWWTYETGWSHDIFHTREEAEKFAEAKAASLPGKKVGLFEEVAQVTVAVNPVTTWKEVS